MLQIEIILMRQTAYMTWNRKAGSYLRLLTGNGF